MSNKNQISIKQANRINFKDMLDIIIPLEKSGKLITRDKDLILDTIAERYFIATIMENGVEKTIGIGGMQVFLQDYMAEIFCIAILKKYRLLGAGKILVQYLEERAKKLGVTTTFCLTTSAYPWFKKQGYVDLDIKKIPKEKHLDKKRLSKPMFKQI